MQGRTFASDVGSMFRGRDVRSLSRESLRSLPISVPDAAILHEHFQRNLSPKQALNFGKSTPRRGLDPEWLQPSVLMGIANLHSSPHAPKEQTIRLQNRSQRFISEVLQDNNQKESEESAVDPESEHGKAKDLSKLESLTISEPAKMISEALKMMISEAEVTVSPTELDNGREEHANEADRSIDPGEGTPEPLVEAFHEDMENKCPL